MFRTLPCVYTSAKEKRSFRSAAAIALRKRYAGSARLSWTWRMPASIARANDTT